MSDEIKLSNNGDINKWCTKYNITIDKTADRNLGVYFNLPGKDKKDASPKIGNKEAEDFIDMLNDNNARFIRGLVKENYIQDGVITVKEADQIANDYYKKAIFNELEDKKTNAAKIKYYLEKSISKQDLLKNIDKDGNTPLMIAVKEGKDKAAVLLLDAGSDLSVKNNLGDDVLALVIKHGSDEQYLDYLYIAVKILEKSKTTPDFSKLLAELEKNKVNQDQKKPKSNIAYITYVKQLFDPAKTKETRDLIITQWTAKNKGE